MPSSNRPANTNLPSDLLEYDGEMSVKLAVDVQKAIIEIAEKLPEDVVARLEILAKNPIVQTLVQFIPGVGPAFGVAVATTYEKICEIRSRIFFEELGKGNITLTEDDVSNHEFLHAYFNTVNYVIRTRRRTKIRLFASLFTTYCQNKRFNRDADDYEDYLNILDDLSYREFQVLCVLCRFERDAIHYGQASGDTNNTHRASLYWNDFLDALQDELNMAKDQVPGVLARLNRTGLYETFVGEFFSTAGRGHLTPQFYSFLDATGVHVNSVKISDASDADSFA